MRPDLCRLCTLPGCVVGRSCLSADSQTGGGRRRDTAPNNTQGQGGQGSGGQMVRADCRLDINIIYNSWVTIAWRPPPLKGLLCVFMSKTADTHQKACAGVRSSSRAVGEESLQAAQLLQ